MQFNRLGLIGLVVLVGVCVDTIVAEQYYTRDEFVGADCPESGFRRRYVYQAGKCTQSQVAQCQADGSVTLTSCPADSCDSPTSCPVRRYAGGCYNYYTDAIQYSARITCGNGLAVAPSGYSDTQGVTYREFVSETCDSTTEPGKFIYADMRAPNACISNYTYFCEAGIPKRQKWLDSSCTVNSGLTATDYSASCNLGSERVCATPTIFAGVATIQSNTTLPVVQSVLPGPAPTYAAKEYFFDSKLTDLRSRELTKIGYCDSGTKLEYFKYECLRNGIRENKCSDNGCSVSCLKRDHIIHDGTYNEIPSGYGDGQYYMRAYCGYVPGPVAKSQSGYTYIQFAPENKQCNLNSPESADFKYAYWIVQDRCMPDSTPTKVECAGGVTTFNKYTDGTCSTLVDGASSSDTLGECLTKTNPLDPTWKANYNLMCGAVEFIAKFATNGATTIASSSIYFSMIIATTAGLMLALQ